MRCALRGMRVAGVGGGCVRVGGAAGSRHAFEFLGSKCSCLTLLSFPPSLTPSRPPSRLPTRRPSFPPSLPPSPQMQKAERRRAKAAERARLESEQASLAKKTEDTKSQVQGMTEAEIAGAA
jgi:hypothetical protein